MKASNPLEVERVLNMIEGIQNRLERKLERRRTAGDTGPGREVLQELGIYLEELRVAAEELRHQSEDLARERQRYVDLFDFAPDAYLVTDAEGVIQETNRAAARLLKCHQEFLIGKPLVVFVATEEHKAFLTRLTTLRTETVEKAEDWAVTMKPRDGPAFRAAISVGAIRDPVSRLIGVRWAMRATPR